MGPDINRTEFHRPRGTGALPTGTADSFIRGGHELVEGDVIDLVAPAPDLPVIPTVIVAGTAVAASPVMGGEVLGGLRLGQCSLAAGTPEERHQHVDHHGAELRPVTELTTPAAPGPRYGVRRQHVGDAEVSVHQLVVGQRVGRGGGQEAELRPAPPLGAVGTVVTIRERNAAGATAPALSRAASRRGVAGAAGLTQPRTVSAGAEALGIPAAAGAALVGWWVANTFQWWARWDAGDEDHLVPDEVVDATASVGGVIRSAFAIRQGDVIHAGHS